MADNLKEFTNKTFTSEDLVDGQYYDLVSNGATTQAVVRDIQVDSTVPLPEADLLNGSFRVAGTETLTGSEFVEKNTKLRYKLKSKPAPYYSTLFYSSRTNQGFTANQLNYNASHATSAVSESETVYTSNNTMTATPMWCVISPNGNYAYHMQYDGNSQCNFRVANFSSGVHYNSWGSSFQSGSYTYKVVGDDGYIYWQDGWYVKRLSMDGGSGAVSEWNISGHIPSTPSTYTKSSFANGVFALVISASYTSKVWLCHWGHSSVCELELNGALQVGSYYDFALTFDPIADKYYVVHGRDSSNMVDVFEIPGSALDFSGNASSKFTYSQSIKVSFDLEDKFRDSQAMFTPLPDGSFGYVDTLGNFKSCSVDGLTRKVVIPNAVAIDSGAPQGVVVASSGPARPISDYQLDITVKVSGVEITGV